MCKKSQLQCDRHSPPSQGSPSQFASYRWQTQKSWLHCFRPNLPSILGILGKLKRCSQVRNYKMTRVNFRWCRSRTTAIKLSERARTQHFDVIKPILKRDCKKLSNPALIQQASKVVESSNVVALTFCAFQPASPVRKDQGRFYKGPESHTSLRCLAFNGCQPQPAQISGTNNDRRGRAPEDEDRQSVKRSCCPQQRTWANILKTLLFET